MSDETQLLHNEIFAGHERIQGREFGMEFHWVPFEALAKIKAYPANIADLMKRYNEGVQHFICREGI
ncbi:MAG: hypothetical protein FWC93_00840 [Defluviitaleaceae bacterium]|nr:hypothetical protein [Defluviitaleaceae bacterium]